jgi:hypothetical protein
LPFADGEEEIILVEVPNSKSAFVLRPSTGELEEAGMEKKAAPVTESVLMKGDPVKLEDLIKTDLK